MRRALLDQAKDPPRPTSYSHNSQPDARKQNLRTTALSAFVYSQQLIFVGILSLALEVAHSLRVPEIISFQGKLWFN